MLLVSFCRVPCDGLAFYPVEFVLVTLCWEPCDGLASYPGKGVGGVGVGVVFRDGLAFHL